MMLFLTTDKGHLAIPISSESRVTLMTDSVVSVTSQQQREKLRLQGQQAATNCELDSTVTWWHWANDILLPSYVTTKMGTRVSTRQGCCAMMCVQSLWEIQMPMQPSVFPTSADSEGGL